MEMMKTNYHCHCYDALNSCSVWAFNLHNSKTSVLVITVRFYAKVISSIKQAPAVWL